MIDALKLLDAQAVVTEAPVVLLAADEAVAVEPISLQLAKDHLRVQVDDDNDYIAALIVAARQMAEGKLNRTLARRSRTAVYDGWGDGMALPNPPLVSVDAVRYFDMTGASQTLPVEDYLVNAHAEPARITRRYGSRWPTVAPQAGAVLVEYTAGYDTVPAPIIQWMLLAIGTMYNNRESIVNGTISQALGDEFVKYLLQPYMVYE